MPPPRGTRVNQFRRIYYDMVYGCMVKPDVPVCVYTPHRRRATGPPQGQQGAFRQPQLQLLLLDALDRESPADACRHLITAAAPPYQQQHLGMAVREEREIALTFCENPCL
jgi:hypothetical protein